MADILAVTDSDEDRDGVFPIHRPRATRWAIEVVSISMGSSAHRRLARHAAAARGVRVTSNLGFQECTEVSTQSSSLAISSGDEVGASFASTAPQRGAAARSRLAARPAARARSPQRRRLSQLPDPVVAAAGLDFSNLAENLEEPSFYVEYYYHGAEPRCCGACREFFVAGHLRLGYHPRASQASPPALRHPIWVHAPKCFRRGKFGITLLGAVAFDSAVGDSTRARVLEELVAEHERQAEAVWPGQATTPRPLPTRPWGYSSSEPRHWSMVVVPGPVAQAESASRPVLAALAARSSRQATFEARWAGIDARLSRIDSGAGDIDLPDAIQPTQWPIRTAEGAGVTSLLEAIPPQWLETDEAEPCVICYEPMMAGEEARRLPCIHIFHRVCIDRWLGMRPFCPLDKKTLSEMLPGPAGAVSDAAGNAPGDAVISSSV